MKDCGLALGLAGFVIGSKKLVGSIVLQKPFDFEEIKSKVLDISNGSH